MTNAAAMQPTRSTGESAKQGTWQYIRARSLTAGQPRVRRWGSQESCIIAPPPPLPCTSHFDTEGCGSLICVCVFRPWQRCGSVRLIAIRDRVFSPQAEPRFAGAMRCPCLCALQTPEAAATGHSGLTLQGLVHRRDACAIVCCQAGKSYPNDKKAARGGTNKLRPLAQWPTQAISRLSYSLWSQSSSAQTGLVRLSCPLAPRLPPSHAIPTIHTRRPSNDATQMARSETAATCGFLGCVIGAHYLLQGRNHPALKVFRKPDATSTPRRPGPAENAASILWHTFAAHLAAALES